ncbi:3185_t:CDS:2, partial [Ambispora gerdemannii]
FSRVEAGRLEARYCETNIAKHTLELVSNFESMAKSFGLNFIIDIPNHQEFERKLKQKVFLDLDLYEKIVFNLCSNAFKYTWRGSVTVRLYTDIKELKEVVVFEVEDTGVGISPEHLSNLFQRFYRIESHQARSHEGTGIGLALVKELATRHGGDIEVESHVDVGSKFKIWMPTGYDHLPLKNVIIESSGDMHDGIGDNREKHLYSSLDLYLDESKHWIQDEPKFNDISIQQNITLADEQTAIKSLQSLNLSSPITDSITSTSRTSPFLSEKCTDSDKSALILIVDDNTDMRNYLSNVLKTEFKVQCATDGRDALGIIQNKKIHPDLVLSGMY